MARLTVRLPDAPNRAQGDADLFDAFGSDGLSIDGDLLSIPAGASGHILSLVGSALMACGWSRAARDFRKEIA